MLAIWPALCSATPRLPQGSKILTLAMVAMREKTAMTVRRLTLLFASLALVASAALPSVAAEPVRLKGYNAAIGESSISGISSGAFMAVQFGTAWSSVIKGVGIVAGGPYWCALADSGDIMTAYMGPVWRALGPCMRGPASDLDIKDFVAKADINAAAKRIDPTENLARQKIYLFRGTNDAIVARPVSDATAAFYRNYLGDLNRGNLFYQTAIGAGHSLVVQQQDAAELNACNANQSPYIDQCNYDQAGIMLQHIYGRLNAPNRGELKGRVLRFDQAAYTGADIPDALSLGDAGYVFVPQDCTDGAACRVHIALHGCKQDTGNIGQRFVDSTGYNAWADTNRLIVLYPQTKASRVAPSNPQACWDWWTYINHSDDYVTKKGLQIRTIKAMLDAVTAGLATAEGNAGTGTPDLITATIPAVPTLTVIDTSDSAAALAFDPTPPTTLIRVLRAERDGPFKPVGETTGGSFADNGLAPATTYRWRITMIRNGGEGASSAEVSATTRPTPPACDTPGSCPVAVGK